MIKAVLVAVALFFFNFFNSAYAQNVDVRVQVIIDGVPQNNFNQWQPGLPNSNLIPVDLNFDPRFVYDSRQMNTSLGFSGLVFNRLNILGLNPGLEVYRVRGISATIKTWGEAVISVCNQSGCVRETVYNHPSNFDNFRVWTDVPLFVADSNSWMLFPLEISAFGVFRLNTITVFLEQIQIQPRGNVVVNPGFQQGVGIVSGIPIPTGPGGPGVPIPPPPIPTHPVPHPLPTPTPHGGGNVIINNNNVITSGNSDPNGLIFRNY